MQEILDARDQARELMVQAGLDAQAKIAYAKTGPLSRSFSPDYSGLFGGLTSLGTAIGKDFVKERSKNGE